MRVRVMHGQRDLIYSCMAGHESVGYMHCRYDEFFALSRRRFVPPNFAEMRHVLNIAQVSLTYPHSTMSQACTNKAL